MTYDMQVQLMISNKLLIIRLLVGQTDVSPASPGIVASHATLNMLLMPMIQLLSTVNYILEPKTN